MYPESISCSSSCKYQDPGHDPHKVPDTCHRQSHGSGSGYTAEIKQSSCDFPLNVSPSDIKISIDIPAGVDNESVIPIRGQGEPGTNGGPAGDLYIVISVKPHKLFTRHGDDLYIDMPVSFDQAALGAELIVPTLEGKVSYKIPTGTQPGTVFRLRDKGIKHLRRESKGDLYVKINLEVPTKLNGKQKKAITEMAKVISEDCYQKKGGFAEKLKEMFK